MKRPPPSASLAIFCLALGGRASAQDQPKSPRATAAPGLPTPQDPAATKDEAAGESAEATVEPPGKGGEASAEVKASGPAGAAAPVARPPSSARQEAAAEPELPDEELELPLIPRAPDDLTGHFRLALGGGFSTPFGSFQADLRESDRIATGGALAAMTTYGVSPTVALGIGGDVSFFSSSEACPACSATSIGFGPLIAYHLVQGTRFDPWAALGVGYRTTTLTSGPADQSYSGIEWLHLEVGGDWYPWPNLGFGPFMELRAGVYGSRPADADRDTYWNFLAGFRAVLQAPAKAADTR